MPNLFMFGFSIDGVFATIFTLLNTGIYKFVGWLYEIFMYIAGARLLKSDYVEPIIHRVQLIIGVVMLFIMAFAIIKIIIDPDKEMANSSKIAKNFIVSLIMLTLVNTAFNYLYEGQKVLLASNVIGKVILGSSGDTTCKLEDAGYCMATDTLAAFFEEDVEAAIEEELCKDSSGATQDLYEEGMECYYSPDDDDTDDVSYAYSKKEIVDYIKKTHYMTKGFMMLENVYENGAIDYSWFLALIAGLYMVYIFLSFCFDMAVRTAKLAVLQMISPIAIISRVIPGQESIFNNWIKKTTTAFFEVFIKIAIIFFGIYLILLVDDITISGGYFEGISGFTEAIAKIIIILGVLMFIKQAPSYISEIFGVNSGDMKLGIKDKLASAGVFGMGAGVGALATQAVHNYKDGIANGKNPLKSGLSAAAGGLSAGVRAGRKGWSGKSFADMRSAATHGIDKATDNREKRRDRKDKYGRFSAVKQFGNKASESVGAWARDDRGEYARLTKVSEKQNEVKQAEKDYNSIVDDIVNKNKFTLKDPKTEKTLAELEQEKNIKFKVLESPVMDKNGKQVGTARKRVEKTAADMAADEKKYMDALKAIKKGVKNGAEGYRTAEGKVDPRITNAAKKYRQAVVDNFDYMSENNMIGGKTKEQIESIQIEVEGGLSKDMADLNTSGKESLDKAINETNSKLNELSSRFQQKKDN